MNVVRPDPSVVEFMKELLWTAMWRAGFSPRYIRTRLGLRPSGKRDSLYHDSIGRAVFRLRTIRMTLRSQTAAEMSILPCVTAEPAAATESMRRYLRRATVFDVRDYNEVFVLCMASLLCAAAVANDEYHIIRIIVDEWAKHFSVHAWMDIPMRFTTLEMVCEEYSAIREPESIHTTPHAEEDMHSHEDIIHAQEDIHDEFHSLLTEW